MIVLGIVCLLLGLLLPVVHFLWIVGVVLIAVGLVLALFGLAGHGVGGRSHYF